MDDAQNPDVTHLLRQVQGGDDGALQDLLPLIHGELHRLAQQLMKGESTEHTLQATALVNEAYLRLFKGESPSDFESKRHFIRVAARAMRGILIDHARAKKSQKRGGERAKVAFDEIVERLQETGNLSALRDAMNDLTEMDPELAQIVDLRFFAGFTIAETADILGSSTPTIERRWRIARAWLRDNMS